MNEYKVVYWEDESGELSFGRTVKSSFEKELNELAQEGWVVKSSNITQLPQANTEKIKISAYALLERAKIPAPFRAHTKNNV